MRDDQSAEKGRQIPTNLRMLVVLEHVARIGEPVLPSVLSDLTGLPKPTIHRLLATAEAEGLLQRDVAARKYGPGKRLREFAANTLSCQRVRTERLLRMKALAARVGETCNLAAPGRYGMIYLDRVETHWPLQIKLPIGSQVPFHCTASGKMFLSSMRPAKLSRLIGSLDLAKRTSRTLVDAEDLGHELNLTRRRGFATDNEEFMDGMVAIAVPIRDTEKRLLTTLSIHAPRQRHDVESLTTYLPLLQDSAKGLEELI